MERASIIAQDAEFNDSTIPTEVVWRKVSNESAAIAVLACWVARVCNIWIHQRIEYDVEERHIGCFEEDFRKEEWHSRDYRINRKWLSDEVNRDNQ